MRAEQAGLPRQNLGHGRVLLVQVGLPSLDGVSTCPCRSAPAKFGRSLSDGLSPGTRRWKAPLRCWALQISAAAQDRPNLAGGCGEKKPPEGGSGVERGGFRTDRADRDGGCCWRRLALLQPRMQTALPTSLRCIA